MLNEYERKRLHEVEQSLEESDPQFSKSLDDGMPARAYPPPVPTHAMIGVPALMLIGLGIISFSGGLVTMGVIGGMIAVLVRASGNQAE